MIRVEVSRNASDIRKIIVSGHAGQGPLGHDLCCAAVSGIVFGGFNALQDDETLYHYDIQEGYASLEVLAEIDSHDKVVLETILTQLESIQASYPRNIEIHLKKE